MLMNLHCFIAGENSRNLRVFRVYNSFAQKMGRVKFLTNFMSTLGPKLGKASMEKKTFSFGDCPNPLTPPPDPNSGNLVLFLGHQNSRFESHLKKMWGGRYINNLKNT